MSKSSRDLILEATANLLVIKGYNAFSFADISGDVGLAKATIHHHFPSKEDLVIEVLITYREQINSGLKHLSSTKSNPLERLKGYIHYWQECIESGERPFCICVLLAAELPSLPKAIQKQVKLHFEELNNWITAVFSEGKKSGVLNIRESVKTEAENFRAQVHGAMLASRALSDAKAFISVTSNALHNLAVK